MPFRNQVGFDYTAPLFENIDYYLWRGQAGVPQELPVTLSSVNREKFYGDPCFTFPAAAAGSMNCGNLPTIIRPDSAAIQSLQVSAQLSYDVLTELPAAIFFLTFNTPTLSAIRISVINVGASRGFRYQCINDAGGTFYTVDSPEIGIGTQFHTISVTLRTPTPNTAFNTTNQELTIIQDGTTLGTHAAPYSFNSDMPFQARRNNSGNGNWRLKNLTYTMN